MEVADDRHVEPAVARRATISGTARGCSSLLTVTRTSSEPARQRRDLLGGSRRVRGVGVGHRLHDDRMARTDGDAAHADRDCLSSRSERHWEKRESGSTGKSKRTPCCACTTGRSFCSATNWTGASPPRRSAMSDDRAASTTGLDDAADEHVAAAAGPGSSPARWSVSLPWCFAAWTVDRAHRTPTPEATGRDTSRSSRRRAGSVRRGRASSPW